MPTLRLHTRGPAPAAEVWERYAVPARWPEWSPQIRRVTSSAPRIAPGVTGVVHGPAVLRVPFTVTAVDEAGRTWSWTVRFGPLRLVLHHAVIADGARTLTTLALTGPRPVITAYAPLAALALRRLVR